MPPDDADKMLTELRKIAETARQIGGTDTAASFLQTMKTAIKQFEEIIRKQRGDF